MTTEKALAVMQDISLNDMANALAKSGFFTEVKDAAQAIVKILYARELGIGPVTAMRGVYFSNGKPCLDAGLISALIKRSGKYNYEIIRLDDEGCELQFLEGEKKISPVISFTKADANKAGLLEGRTSANYKKYPRNMYFARALTNGARWHCADVFGGAVYTPDELEVVDGEVISDTSSAPSVIDAETKEKVGPEVRMVTTWSGKEYRAEEKMGAKVVATLKFEELFIKKFSHSEHFLNHIKKHFGVENAAELTWEMAVALHKHLYNKVETMPWYPPEPKEEVIISGWDAGKQAQKLYVDKGFGDLYNTLHTHMETVLGSINGNTYLKAITEILKAVETGVYVNPPTESDITDMKATLDNEFRKNAA